MCLRRRSFSSSRRAILFSSSFVYACIYDGAQEIAHMIFRPRTRKRGERHLLARAGSRGGLPVLDHPLLAAVVGPLPAAAVLHGPLEPGLVVERVQHRAGAHAQGPRHGPPDGRVVATAQVLLRLELGPPARVPAARGVGGAAEVVLERHGGPRALDVPPHLVRRLLPRRRAEEVVQVHAVVHVAEREAAHGALPRQPAAVGRHCLGAHPLTAARSQHRYLEQMTPVERSTQRRLPSRDRNNSRVLTEGAALPCLEWRRICCRSEVDGTAQQRQKHTHNTGRCKRVWVSRVGEAGRRRAGGRQEFRTPQRGRWAWANEGRQAMPGKKNPKRVRRGTVPEREVKREGAAFFSSAAQGEATAHGFFPPAMLCSANYIRAGWCCSGVCTTTGRRRQRRAATS